MKRKLLSVLMALCLILTLLPTAVFAEELTPPEESGEQQEEQIKEPSTPEKEPDDPEKEQEGEEDLQPSDGDPELPAGDGEDERDPQTPEDGVQDPTGRKSLKMAAPLCRMRCRFRRSFFWRSPPLPWNRTAGRRNMTPSVRPSTLRKRINKTPTKAVHHYTE